MRKVIMIVATVVLAIGLVSCGATSTGTSSPGAGQPAAPTTTSTTSSSTTAAAPTSTVLTFIAPSTSTAQPSTTTRPVIDDVGTLLKPGDSGLLVEALQQKLKSNGLDPGPIDGLYGAAVESAVRTFQHLNDLDADGVIGPLTMAAFDHPKKIEPMRPEGPPDRVEVSISRKLLVLYKDNVPLVVTHVSSGSQIPFCENGVCGDAVTPIGDFHAMMKIDGWEHGPLGDMYNSVYFWPAYALHGSPYVPNVGMSHGCVRVPMHIADYLPSLIAYGEPIYIMA